MASFLDPLNQGDSQSIKDQRPADSEEVRQGHEDQHNSAAVLHWSPDRVRTWLQQNVSFGNDRMQECLHAFQNEGVDGLSLLTLKRNHRACLGMTDFEWLLLKVARKRLLTGGGREETFSSESLDSKNQLSFSTQTFRATPQIESSNSITSPMSPHLLRSKSSNIRGPRHSQAITMLSSSLKLFNFSKISWSPNSAKNEQVELLVAEVQSLRGEVVSTEERETTLQAQLDHLDGILRTAQLAGYLYTRTRWIPLPGEITSKDVDVDDWFQRFLVLHGSSIFFYFRATDLRPQGTILLDEIVNAGPMQSFMREECDRKLWYAFHITTCHGLRLECSTPLKLQMDSWLTSIGIDYEAGSSLQHYV